MRKLIFILFIIPFCVFSQGGSNYSSIGIGDVYLDNGAVFGGMAGTSIAMPSSSAINMENPSLWTKLDLTKIQMSYRFNQALISTEDESLFQNAGVVDNFTAVFMMDTANGLSLGLGFNNYSNLSYKVSSRFSEYFETISASGKTIKTGSGGISNAFIGLSAEFFDMLSVNVTPSYLFGTIDEVNEILYDEQFGLDTYVAQKSEVAGFNFKYSMAIQFKHFYFGAHYQTPTNMEVSNFDEYGFINSSSALKIDTLESSFEIPARIGLGIAYSFDRIKLGIDYTSQNFSNMNFNSGDRTSLGTLNLFSFGFERIGSFKSSAKGIDKWDLRAGLAYKQTQYMIDGESINDIYGSLGTSIPFGSSSYFDVAMVLGNRGRVDKLLVQEQYAKFIFNLSIGEDWFNPFDRGYDDIDE